MRRRWVGVIALAVALSSCGDDDALAPDPSLDLFVGDWRTASLVVASPVAPDLSVDLIELGQEEEARDIRDDVLARVSSEKARQNLLNLPL